MRNRMVLGSIGLAVWLFAAGAMGQAAEDTATNSDSQPTSSGSTDGSDAGAPSASGGLSLSGQAGVGADGGAAAATASTSEGVTANAAEKAEMDAATYAVRLRDLEQRINELKEQIFRSKARLSLLAETVLQGVVAGSQTAIVHENKMSSSYRLVKVVYALDGAPIFNRTDEEGGLSEREEFDIYNGSIVPGEHTLTVNLEYRGHGYGIFSYLKGYRFKVRSSHTFSAPESKGINVRVVAYEKGGPTAPLEERPAIRYQERIVDAISSEPTPGAEGGE